MRQERMVSVVHAAAAEFFVEHSRDWGIDALALVEQVFVSPDLHHVEIWVSLAPWKREKATKEFAVVERHLGELKKWLAERIELRRFPEVVLRLSDPEKTFRIMDIFGTLDGHGEPDRTNQGNSAEVEENSADDPHQP